MDGLLQHLLDSGPSPKTVEILGVAVHPVSHPWVLAGGLAALAALVIFLYSREQMGASRVRRYLLVALRLLALLAVVPMLLELGLRVRETETQRSLFAVLVDTSESMGFADMRRVGPGDTEDELPPAKSATRYDTRLARVQEVLASAEVGLATTLQRRYVPAAFTFNRTAVLRGEGRNGGGDWLGEVLSATPDGSATRLGGALAGAAERLRGNAIAGMLVFSDGAETGEQDPRVVAQQAAQRGIPLFMVGVGQETPPDIEIRQVITDDFVFARDPATVLVRVRCRGYPDANVPLRLYRGQVEVARAEARFDSGETETLVPVKFAVEQPGTFTFSIDTPVLSDEVFTDNNRKTFTLRVTEDRIRILHVENEPRWEFRFLKTALLRDRRLDPRFLLLSASRSGTIPGKEFLPAFPSTEEELFRFDVIYLGDVDLAYLSSGQLEWLRRYVAEEGGGLIFQAGRHFMPGSAVGTPLEDLLPVKTDRVIGGAGNPIGSPGRFRVLPSAEALKHPLMTLSHSSTESETLWRSLPECLWHFPVDKPKPGATVLSEIVSPGSADPKPLIAVQPFGRGRTLYVGLDETWRWRFRHGDRFFYRFWGRILYYLGSPHLSRSKSRLAIETDQYQVPIGENTVVTVRVFDRTLDLGDMTPEGIARDERGEEVKFHLRRSTASEEVFEGKFAPPEAGLYRIWVQGLAVEGSTSIEAVASNVETRNPGMNQSLLQEIAHASGGRYARLDEVSKLLAELPPGERLVSWDREVTLWNRWPFLALFVLALGLEWIFRKFFQLA